MDIPAFFKKVDIGDGCWYWKGSINRDGYGVFTGKLAHRVIFEHVYGPFPAGTVADHICHNKAVCAGGMLCLHRRCVNPTHLRAATRGENVRAGRTGVNARVRHVCVRYCQNGHEFTEDNTYVSIDSRGWVHRRCKTCAKRRRREQYERERSRTIIPTYS